MLRLMGPPFLAYQLTAGFCLKNLSCAKQEIDEAINLQLPRPPADRGLPHRCLRCNLCMATPTLYSADAGQACEMVDSGFISACLGKLHFLFATSARYRILLLLFSMQCMA